jgi:hypothetical protein
LCPAKFTSEVPYQQEMSSIPIVSVFPSELNEISAAAHLVGISSIFSFCVVLRVTQTALISFETQLLAPD